MSLDALGLGLAVLSAAALASQSLFVRWSSTRQSVTDIIGVVFLVNLGVLLPTTLLLYTPDLGLTTRSVAAFATGGVLGSLLARASLFVGIERLGASRAEPLKSTFPLVAVAGAIVVLGEPLSLTLVAGVVLLVVGAAAVSWDARASPATRTGRHAWVDVSFPLAAALLLGIDPLFTSIGLAEGTPALVGVTVRVLAGATGFGLYLAWSRWQSGTGPTLRPTRWSLAVGVANTAYLVSYLAALARVPVSVVAPIQGASPMLVLLVVAAVARDEEAVTARLGLAVTVLVAGVVLVVSG